EPENLGPEINSSLEDLFFNIPANSEYAYYSRGVSETNTDIYRVKLPILRKPEVYVTVRGKIVDGETGEPIGAKVIYERLPGGEETGIAQTNPETGEYEIRLPGGHMYGIRAEAADKISESQSLDLTGITEDRIIDVRDFRLGNIRVADIAKDVTIVLNNVFFDFDKADLKPESYPELDRIASVMKERPDMVIEVSGHTDSMGPESYNQGLSRRRAQAVVNYLTRSGINANRLKVAYFGESKPIES